MLSILSKSITIAIALVLVQAVVLSSQTAVQKRSP